MASIFDTVSSHRKTLGGFASLRDQGVYVYGRNLRRCSWSLPGRHSIAQVRLRGQPAAGAGRSRMRLLDVGKGEWAYRTEADDASGGRSVDALPLAKNLAALKKAGADFQIVSQMNRKSCPVVMLRRTKSLH